MNKSNLISITNYKSPYKPIENEFSQITRDVNLYRRQTQRQLMEYRKSILFAMSAYIIKQKQDVFDQMDLKVISSLVTPEEYSRIIKLKSYSSFNIFAYFRRYMRLKHQAEGILNGYRLRLDTLAKMTQQMNGEHEYKMNHCNNKHFTELYYQGTNLYADIKNFANIALDLKLGDIHYLFSNILNYITISKHEFLQLITVDHSNKYQQLINTLPELIDNKSFEEAIWVERVELDQDCPFFEIYYDNFCKMLDENKGLSDKMFDKVQETFGAIQTFTMNENGELEPSKPKLKRIK